MTSLLDRQREFAGYLVVGFPELSLASIPLKSACAATGNATQENNVKPVTSGPLDHGSDGAMQWRLTRLDGPTGLRGWAAAHNLPWDTLRTQAAFFLWECEQYYPALLKDLRAGAKSIETLTANISKFYERPSRRYEELDKRIAAAKTVYHAMSGSPPPLPVPPPPSLPPVLQPMAANPHTSNVGWMVIAYGFACFFRITIFGYPAEGDAILAWLLGAYMLWAPDAKAPTAGHSEENMMLADNLVALKNLLSELVPAVHTLVAAHTDLQTKVSTADAVDQELTTLLSDLSAAVTALKTLVAPQQ